MKVFQEFNLKLLQTNFKRFSVDSVQSSASSDGDEVTAPLPKTPGNALSFGTNGLYFQMVNTKFYNNVIYY